MGASVPHRVRLTPEQIVAIDDEVERRRAIALQAAELGVFEHDLRRDLSFWDDRVHELWGIPPDEALTYDLIISTLHPDDKRLHREILSKVLDPDGPRRFDYEFRIYPADGAPVRWIHAKANVLFNQSTAIRLVGTVQDVTERRQAQERAQVLVDELEHRVKNTLTSVISLIALSSRGHSDVTEFSDALRERISAMAHAHDLLRGNDWRPIRFGELLRLYTEGILGPGHSRVVLSGPEPKLDPDHIPTISMAIHELFTNAMKYGALSDDQSKVEIQSFVSEEEMGFIWREKREGPQTQALSRAGFGSLLLTKILPSELGGTGIIDLGEEGLQFTLRYPVRRTVKT